MAAATGTSGASGDPIGKKGQKRTVVGRLFAYAMMYKGRIAFALTILLMAVVADLAGPYITKTVIDRHISGIQKAWYSVPQEEVREEWNTVTFRNRQYVREDWIGGVSPGTAWEEAHISQAGGTFYLIPQALAFEGEWFLLSGSEDSARIEIRYGDQREQYDAIPLTTADVELFYQHDIGPIFRLIGLYAGLLLIASVLTFVQSYTFQTTALRIIQRMRVEVMEHIQRIPLRYFDNMPTGQIVSRIANDTEAIRDLFMSFMATFVVSFVHLTGIFVAMFILDWKLALTCLLLIPVFAVMAWFYLKFCKVYITNMRARLSDMNALLSESILAMPVIQAFRAEADIQREFDALNEDRFQNNRKQIRVFSLFSRNGVTFVGGMATAGVVWYFGGQSLHTAISFGALYAFIDYLGRVTQPIIGIFEQLLNAQRAVVSAERVFELLDEEGVEVASSEQVPRPQGNVRFEGVYFAYNEGNPVLRNISFEAKQGETVALVGHTGSGKSSIMNLLLGFYEPSGGKILIDGKDITQIPKQQLRKHMGIVLQDPFLFAGDIKFNVSLYNPEITLEKVQQAIRDVGIEPFIRQLPQGLDEPVVERGATLSAGQRQLISFARALAHDPAILILDEATSSIDSETEGLIQNALQVLSRGRTTFVIAHRLSTIKNADLILVLHRGEIVERGNHEELMRLQGRYYRMYQLQTNERAAVKAQ
jgi:ATP-binding cassette subfamily B protein